MVRLFYVLVALLSAMGAAVSAQSVYSPYPIIYIHGLDSDDQAWHETINEFRDIHGSFKPNATTNSGNVFNAMLNRYESMTAMFGPDGIEGNADDDVYTQRTALQRGGVFAVNFNTSWNELPVAPGLYFYQDHWGLGSRESQSNESAIVKQGYALKKCIEEVLRVTGAERVILVGHSMGGLCIREYLQRRQGGVPRWWVNPGAADGHKVARVVTYGTPHFGSNASVFVPIRVPGSDITDPEIRQFPMVPNTSSEAVRDLRYSYLVGSQERGVYLFGGDEAGLNTSVLLSGWHNGDVDCNGWDNDIVRGINQDIDGPMPLPLNIRYTWITSNGSATGTGDFVVDLNRQSLMDINGRPYPEGLADTLLGDRAHWNETSDFAMLIRGLDEPGRIATAYQIELERPYRGTITYQMGLNANDVDCYRLIVPDIKGQRKQLVVRIRDLATTQSRQLLFAVVDDSANVIAEEFGNMTAGLRFTIDSTAIARSRGRLYIVVGGEAIPNGWTEPYEYRAWLETVSNAPPRIAEIRDTVTMKGVRVNIPIAVEDEAIASVIVTAVSNNQALIPNDSIMVDGVGSSRVLRIRPVATETGMTTITVEARDGEHTVTRSFRVRVNDATSADVDHVNDAMTFSAVVYPNPATTMAYLLIESAQDANARVELLSSTGENLGTMFEGVVRAGLNRLPFDVTSVGTGMYAVRITVGERSHVCPFVTIK